MIFKQTFTRGEGTCEGALGTCEDSLISGKIITYLKRQNCLFVRFFYTQSGYKLSKYFVSFECKLPGYSSWKRCKSLQGVLIPFKLTIKSFKISRQIKFNESQKWFFKQTFTRSFQPVSPGTSLASAYSSTCLKGFIVVKPYSFTSNLLL